MFRLYHSRESKAWTAAAILLWLWVLAAFAAYVHQFLGLIPDILRVLGIGGS